MFFLFDDLPYIAVIGDMRNSRHLKDRQAVQARLTQVLNDINRTYAKDIASVFMITLGDEFQGLLTSGASVMYIIDRIEREMYPVQLRFGIGAGAITTGTPSSVPFGADGPAYYLARDAINNLKTSENRKMTPKNNIELKLQNNVQISEIINTLFSLLFAIKEAWTPRQVEIINAYLNGDGTQLDAARRLHVDQSNIQKVLAAANHYTYQSALDTLATVFAEIKEADDV